MYSTAKEYKGYWLAPGSMAYGLKCDGKIKELDALIKRLVAEEEKRSFMPVQSIVVGR